MEVQRILRECVQVGLRATLEGENPNEWSVAEFGNASIVTADKIILLRCSMQNNAGWQWDTEEEEGKLQEHQGTIQSWELHFIRKRKVEDSDETKLTSDYAQLIMAWLNGLGCEWLRKYNMSILRIDNSRLVEYNDNSSLYQRRAVFTVRVCVPKIITINKEVING
jgi:hypothetical protein